MPDNLAAPVAPPDPYATAVMSYADKVKALLEQRAAPVDAMANPTGPPAGPPVTGMLPGAPPENPAQDNMTINARSGEYVFPEPAVKYYGVKKLEDMVHKAIEDINPPGQPAPEPPTQAQTFAKGGLINRKHFLRLPKGHAYDKTSPKKNPLKNMMPTGAPPAAPDAMTMDPSAMQQMQQMAPPAQPTQPPLPSYWGGGLLWRNPDYWQGRNWDINDMTGPQVQIFGGSRQMWNPNSFPPDLPPSSDYQTHQSQHFRPRANKAMGGIVEPDSPYPHFWGGGFTGGPDVQIMRDPDFYGDRNFGGIASPHLNLPNNFNRPNNPDNPPNNSYDQAHRAMLSTLMRKYDDPWIARMLAGMGGSRGGFGEPMGFFNSPGNFYRSVGGPNTIPMTGGIGGGGGSFFHGISTGPPQGSADYFFNAATRHATSGEKKTG